MATQIQMFIDGAWMVKATIADEPKAAVIAMVERSKHRVRLFDNACNKVIAASLSALRHQEQVRDPMHALERISVLALADARESDRPEPDPFSAAMQHPRSKRTKRPELSRPFAKDGR